MPLGQTFEYWRLRVTNESREERQLSVFTYCEFANLWGTWQDLVNLQYSQFITKASLEDGMLGDHLQPVTSTSTARTSTACNRTWMAVTGAPLAGVRDACASTSSAPTAATHAPEAVVKGRCSNELRPDGDNVCGGQQVDLDARARRDPRAHRAARPRHGRRPTAAAPCRSSATRPAARPSSRSSRPPGTPRSASLQVETPDPDFDHMVNVWNAYNALITYAWSRSASLIYNGERDGLGFRDTVQDMLGAIAAPAARGCRTGSS